jgi:hypothetical protein
MHATIICVLTWWWSHVVQTWLDQLLCILNHDSIDYEYYQQRKFVFSNSLPLGSLSDNPQQAASYYSKMQEPSRVSRPHNWLQFPLKKTPMIYFDHDSLKAYTVNKGNLKHRGNFMYRLVWLSKAPAFECIDGFGIIFLHRIKQFLLVLENSEFSLRQELNVYELRVQRVIILQMCITRPA